ncbi:MAG: N(4)-(beta-N-acetylglucosaminyl)-L-asparaginase [Bacteroidota bacterium]
MAPTSRRDFLKLGATAAALSAFWQACKPAASSASSSETPKGPVNKPMVVSTWNHGQAANAAAWEVLAQGGRALDAVEAGVKVTEADPKVSTVGIGGRPDRTGVVSLDACIMDENGDCGSVAFLQNIKHPISVARKVMEETKHVMLVGKGALDFAREQGFPEENLLTEGAEKDWKDWLKKNDPHAKAEINVENHDTIGMVALDADGNLSGACTTSGAAWKLHGRVGDSPIIGAGLYVDNEVGAATATGWGEAVIRAVGCFLVVEFMRQGHHPEEACRLAVERVISKNPDWQEIQVGFLAISKQGEYGAYCIAPGFNYAVKDASHDNVLIDGKSRL